MELHAPIFDCKCTRLCYCIKAHYTATPGTRGAAGATTIPTAAGALAAIDAYDMHCQNAGHQHWSAEATRLQDPKMPRTQTDKCKRACDTRRLRYASHANEPRRGQRGQNVTPSQDFTLHTSLFWSCAPCHSHNQSWAYFMQ